MEQIHELNEIYKELNQLVIMQGSLLDRIDYNIEESVAQVQKGDVKIEEAEKWQKKTSKCSRNVMLLFIAVIAILGIVLIVKWSRK